MVGLLYLVLTIAVIGFCVYLITTYIPMDPIFRQVILVVVAVVILLWLLAQFGAELPTVRLMPPKG